jgi:ParB/RepB/Spo0J family partition protein
MDIQLPDDQAPLRGELADAIQARGESNSAYARRAQVDQGDVSRFLKHRRAGFTAPTWLKLAAAAPEGSALRARFEAHLPAAEAAPAPAAAVASAAAEPGQLFMASYAQLKPSRHNPRKTFNDESIAELAGSIAEQGLLQNLNVCSRGDGTYEINGGERRWRAIGLLIERGEWKADEKRIPCRLINFDQKTADLISIIENLQREDVPRHEQADAIARMRDVHGLGKDDIAKALNCSKRYVEQSLNLVDRLAPEIRKELEEGSLTFEQARQLWTLPVSLQARVLARARTEAEYNDEDRLDIDEAKSDLLDTFPMESDAIFDLADYEGEKYTQGPVTRLLDLDEFERLQKAAIEPKRAELEKKWKAVHVEDGPFLTYQFAKTKAPKKGEAFIAIEPPDDEDDYNPKFFTRVRIHEGYYKPEPSRASAPKPGSSPEDDGPAMPDLSAVQLIMAHAVRTAVLQEAIAAAPLKVSLAALCVALLAITEGEIKIVRSHRHSQDLALQQSPVYKRLLDLLEPLKEAGLLGKRVEMSDGQTWQDIIEGDKQAEAFRFLLEYPRLDELAATLIAGQTGSWPHYTPRYGDADIVTAIAQETEATCHGPFKLTREYLEKCKKPQIEAIARAAIREGHVAIGDMPQKKADAIDWLMDHPDRDESWCAPEYSFASPEENKAAYEAMMKGEAA